MQPTSLQDLIRFFLLPFALIYGLAMRVRNWMYNTGWLYSMRFDVPVISVGNLNVGGTGKTPHIEYLIRLLGPYFKISTLSRGYKRKTTGFILAGPQHSADQSGDEPRQYKLKYPNISVAVGENRLLAIPEIIQKKPDIQAILMDDAFQHRSVNAGFSILLTEFDNLFTRDYVLPRGRLREPRTAYLRSDVIIVTKCPEQVSTQEREAITKEIDPKPYQRVYFSKVRYLTPYYFFNFQQKRIITADTHVLLITGIAKNNRLIEYLKTITPHVHDRNFGDHHFFDRYDMEFIKEAYENIEAEHKIILTTEKDVTRFELHKEYIYKNKLPMFVQPLVVEFLDGDAERFQKDVFYYMQVALDKYMQKTSNE